MKREDDQKLWDLLGQVAEPKVSPFFARNVVREIRDTSGQSVLRRWFSLRRLIPAASVAVAIIGFVLLRTPAPEKAGRADAQDYELIADLDDLAVADDNNSEVDSVLL